MKQKVFRNIITLDSSTEVIVWENNDIKSAKFMKLEEVDFSNKKHRPAIIKGMDYTIIYKDKDSYYAVDIEAENRTWMESVLTKWDEFLVSKEYIRVGEDDINIVYVATKDSASQPLRIVHINKRTLGYMISSPKSAWSPIEAWAFKEEYHENESDASIRNLRFKESPALKNAWDSMNSIPLVNKCFYTYKSYVNETEWYWNGLQNQ